MNCDVTVKSFGDNMQQFDWLIPHISTFVVNIVNNLATIKIANSPAINISDLKTIHIPNDYREELFAYQASIGHQKFATQNKIATGAAQVVDAPDGSHIFIDKQIIMAILVLQFYENNVPPDIDQRLIEQLKAQKLKYLRMIRHELAHVEDGTNQKGMAWLGKLKDEKTIRAGVLKDAIRLWQEFYACQRSALYYDDCAAFEQLRKDTYIAEKEMCELRWKYNTGQMPLTEFVNQFRDYLYTGLVYCAYFCGHYDWGYDKFKTLPFMKMPSRFLKFLLNLWKAFREMNDTYPQWGSEHVLYKLGNIYKACMEEFYIYAFDTDKGVYYDIPAEKLLPYAEQQKDDEK